MKRITNITITFLLMLTMVLPIYAASGYVSISAPGTVSPGESFTVTISYSASEVSVYDFSIGGSGAISGGTHHTADVAGSTSLTMTAGSEGTGYISVSGEGATLSDYSPFGLSASATVNVVAPNTGGNSGGENPGGGNTGGTGTPSGAQETAAEREERETAEREAAEKEEKETAQKTPLIKEIDIVSTADKRLGDVLTKIVPEFDTFEYAYKLPKQVDKFLLEIRGVEEDVVLTYDKNYEYKDGDKVLKEIIVRAVKGEITQEFKLNVTKDETPDIIRDVEGVKKKVYDDDGLDAYMKTLGFARKDYKEGEIPSFFYEKGAVKMQLLVDDQKNASWHTLTKENALSKEVILISDEKLTPFVITGAPEESAVLTLQDEKYTSKEIVIDPKLQAVDSTMKFKNNYDGWAFDDGEVVYGMTVDGVEGPYYKDAKNVVKTAVVGFDKVNQSYKLWAYVATGLLVVVSGSFGSYIFIDQKRKKATLLPKE
ncbi:hypothetical protein G7062_06620 [Erysipelothrix sp. HDW6C]|uniref:hypothetical protein n=1 Tax=Erysipelothrix sp. HDW6C TaxID=2714930 RepID=UPI0014081790|nr:hypothetical protein [Erysipelothrix sp. HDW6C]QIK69981.1 hypothetical protein G7062_06620 [Erysipelothrix sp. HDW6C]